MKRTTVTYTVLAAAFTVWIIQVFLPSPWLILLGTALTASAFTLVLTPSTNSVLVDDVSTSPRGSASSHHARFSNPTSLTPEAVVAALLRNSAEAGAPSAAHLWLEHTATGTLRLINGAGPMHPSSAPVPIDEGILGLALTGSKAVCDRLHAVSTPDKDMTVWRYAVPIPSGAIRSVAAVDFIGTDPPDSEVLNELIAVLGLPLAGAVALHMAEIREEAVHALAKAIQRLTRELDAEEVVTETLSIAMEITSASTGSVMLLGEDDYLRIASAKGLPEAVQESTSVRLGEGIAGWVAACGQPLLIEDLPGRPSRGSRHGVKSALAVPISDEDGLLGVLNVGTKGYPARFTDMHLQVIESLGRQAATALRNARALSTANTMLFDALRALALALETKDPYSHGGTKQVVDLAFELGEVFGLTEEERRALEVAATLHDVGMATAGEALMSSGPLTTMDRSLVTMHPKIAADILAQAPSLSAVVPIVYHHHEHYDGRGYVDGLSAEDIPIGARILAVVDAYVAMISERSYRDAKSSDEALQELQKKAGTQFDPRVVSKFVEFMSERSSRVQGKTD